MFPNRVTSVLGLAVAAATTGCATGLTAAPPAQSQSPALERPAMARPSGTAAGHYAIGAMDLAAGRHASAVARFRAALELDPAHVEALNGIGVAHGETGRHAEAVVSFEQALALAPDTAHLLSNLGYAQLRAGRAEEAWRSLSRSFELDPSSPRTRANLLIALQSRDQAPRETAPADSVRIESASGAAATLRVEPTMRIGHSSPLAQTPTVVTDPRSETAVPAQGVPVVSAPSTTVAGNVYAPFTVVTNRPYDPGLVRVSPNVYELRPSGGTSAVASAVAGDVGAPPRLEVSNGVGLPRLATRTAAELARLGFPQSRLTNARPYGLAQSRLQYRPGHQAQAQRLARAMGVEVEVVATDGLSTAVDLRLVVGLDLATWEQTARLSAPRLAGVPATVAPGSAPTGSTVIVQAGAARF